tara:strand:- start:27 stop:461 length:435 start_codon:yes stop_codon:yes gene_type:complete
MEKRLKELTELNDFAQEYISHISPHENHATLITLQGDLGAGKTAFTKALAKALGVEEHITSPTFVLAKHYTLDNQSFEQLVHIDAYRLEKGEDLGPIEFDQLLKSPKNLVVLEWPECVEEAVPEWAHNVHIVLEGEERIFTYEN